jgi:LysR family transcriptional regulator, glycine cleavage system transcriptional activator
MATPVNDRPLKNRRAAQGKLGVGQAKLPSLSSIRAFEAAARLGSFAKAAQELDTTSASVSYHVRRLEQQIGIRLFLRQAQSVQLTPPGAMLAAESTNAFAALRACFIKAIDADESLLTLTTLPTFGTTWLTPRLGKFRAKHPQITLELDLSEAAHDLTEGRFDAAIRNGHGHWPGLRAIELFPAVFMPLCAPSLQRAIGDIGDPRVPLRAPRLGRPDWWMRWYRARGFDDVALADGFGTKLSAEYLDIAAAVAGHGVAIGSPIIFHHEIRSGRLVPAHDFVAGDGRAFWFTYPAALEHRSKIARFREWLSGEVADALRDADAYIRRVVQSTKSSTGKSG